MWKINLSVKSVNAFLISVSCRVATNSEYGPNTEYIRFWKFKEYQMPNNLFFEKRPNSTIGTQLFEYWIMNNEN